MNQFAKVNNLVGWLLFGVSAIIYTLTVEETASFWDCGEFIAVSYKLEVPHPPGAPLFLLIGRMFSFLALGNVERVAFWINMLSVLSSALTIMFLYWTIVLMAKKMVNVYKEDVLNTPNITAMVAGAIGALSYTFSDSFWFSAVEAEVYALSSLFTAFVFWAMLKWERIEDPHTASRWLILIAYTMGLSIGVHLLNLVTIPALALIFYYKEFKQTNLKGGIIAVFVGLFIVGIINNGIIPGLPTVAGAFEILFVNSLGMPFSSGLFVFLILLISALVYGIHYSEKHKKPVLNISLLSFAFILLGYASYGIILIRSNYDTPIDENDPEDMMSFVRYLKREQYGDRPLLFGPTFLADRVDFEKGSPVYRKGKERYEVVDYQTKAIYDDQNQLLLPRIYSQQPGHDQLYRQWIGLREGEKPTMGDNIYYMFRYQFGHMYFRYFLWNFVGRESDEKEAGVLWPTEDLGKDIPEMLSSNKARNNMFALPLLLGIVGLLFQVMVDKRNFFVLLLLFFLTGLALVLYLNSPPVEPRERDYIYVGSYYVFCIWIGFGVVPIQQALSKALKGSSPVVAGLITLLVPGIMAAEGWDNHDRSNRFHSVDQARNTLSSCAPNAILFTGGDNDTFPLWYVQEVEGFRTDVRVVVLSYFSTDWYIEQMKRSAYDSDPLPLSMDQVNYLRGKNDWVPLVENERTRNAAVNLDAYIRLVDQDDAQVKVKLQDGSYTAKLLTRYFKLDVDSAAVVDMGIVPEGKEGQVLAEMTFGLKENATSIFKNDLALLDILATNDWERPIYFNNTSANSTSLELRQFMHLEGLTYRLLPVRAEMRPGETGGVNVPVMLENINKFKFRGFDDPGVYHDEEYRKFGSNTRNSYYRLARKLYEQGDEEKAKEILDEGLTNIPDKSIPYSFFTSFYAELYHKLGEQERAEALADTIISRSSEMIRFVEENNKTGQFYQDMLRNSNIYLNQLAFVYRRLSDETDREIKNLENQVNLSVEGVPSGELERLRKQLELYQSRYEEILGVMSGGR